jgi:histidinol-phosphatase (PHP family)
LPPKGSAFDVFDYHVHTEFSVDCKVPMADSCRAAIAAGVTEIAFTDHVDHVPTDPGFGYYRADDYSRSLEAARAEFGDRLTILAGAEVDFHTETAVTVEQFIDRYGREYDFVIGSVHYAAGGVIIFPDRFAGRHNDDVFLPYFDQIQAAVETGWFDSIGHLDIPKRYLPRTHRTYDPIAYRGRLEEIFRAMIDRSVAFEINTSGLRQAPKTSMPGPAVVRWYADVGGRLITTGTDSHAAQTVGAGIPKTLDMLDLCGIHSVASFRARSARLVPIEALRPTAVAVG